MSVMRPELIMKSIIPVVMAGIIAIYGLVVSVLIANSMSTPATYSLFMYVALERVAGRKGSLSQLRVPQLFWRV